MRIAVAGGTGVAGRHAVAAVRAAGHEAVVVTRGAGVDARTGQGLDAALEGVDAIVDATNPGVQEEVAATAFYTEVSSHLQAAGARAGARHLVVLSIIGIDDDGAGRYGFYRANLRHEEVARRGEVPVTVLRTTQFHEFPAQLLVRTRKGPVAAVPRMRVQTVAAATVGAALAGLAAGTLTGGTVSLAGPGPVADVVDLTRAVLARQGRRVKVVAVPFPGAAGRAMREGALLPPPDARIEGPSFTDWLVGDDVLSIG